MFRSVAKFLARRVLPLIASELDFSFKTVERVDGFYFKITVTVFNYILLDKEIKFSSQSSSGIATKETLRLDEPIDISRQKALRLPDSFTQQVNKNAIETFK